MDGTLNSIEEEVIFLYGAMDAINTMVNYQIMDIGQDSIAHFKSETHLQYFNLLLVDFLSKVDKRGRSSKQSYLGALRSISCNPNFSVRGSVSDLKVSVNKFVSWLQEEIAVDTWFASLSLEAKIQISRIDYLKMCGDLSKHNILRAIGVADKLRTILEKSGSLIDQDQSMLALDDFYARFHTDIFAYQATIVASSLNDIRWGIYTYMRPEFLKNIRGDPDDRLPYTYTYPPALGDKFSKACYWELMNLVRDRPFVQKFSASKWVGLHH